ncbi:hypothetical protein QBC34DRAFT_436510 [Podospora aff. communis PSN243]|uniref:Uncharacterized protein n=1 Tax=Podospora aff. communis PSN243 TaxID=3040156 RepID=A0AAV9GT12_9PEZI|nr:hypothetical protein QBC34DRAFT_436510 [Podospora aff. communis PSN243]
MFQRFIAVAFCVAQARAVSVSHSAVQQVPEDAWMLGFANPNATGEIRFRGYNITAPFPGVESDDWRFTIKVRDGLPQRASDPSRLVTGLWIELDPPDNLVQRQENQDIVPRDPSWQVCQGFWELSNLKSSAQNVDASCEGVLPAACVSAITRQLRTDFGIRAEGRSFQCPDLSVTDPACRDVFEASKGGVAAVGTTLPAGNQSDLTPTGAFDYARMGLSGDNGGHALGNFTAYDEALRRVFPYDNYDIQTPGTVWAEDLVNVMLPSYFPLADSFSTAHNESVSSDTTSLANTTEDTPTHVDVPQRVFLGGPDESLCCNEQCMRCYRRDWDCEYADRNCWLRPVANHVSLS